MACYDGVPERDMWLFIKPIDMFEGETFWLNAYMTRH